MVYNAKSDTSGTISTFNYRKKLTINHSGALTSYQVKLIVDHVNTNMKIDFGDIRFNTEAGDYIPYWIEKQVNDISADVWIKTDLVDSNTIIYMYYGNANLTSASDVNTTFIRVIGSSTEQPVKGAWTLDGNALDTSGNSNNGTLYGGMGYTTGKFGQAGLFDGVSNYIDIGSVDKTKWNWLHGAADTSNFKFTVEAWLKITDFTNTNAFLGTSDIASPAVGIGFYIGTTRTITIFIARSVSGQAVVSFSTSASSYPADSNFHHVVFAYDQSLTSGNIKVYLDGTLTGTGNKTGNTPSTSSSSDFLRIGWAGNGAYSGMGKFKGTIDEVRIYNRVLTQPEITDLYNNYGYTTTNYPGRELVRKYTSPEPTYTTFAEQTNQSFAYRLPIVINNTTNNNTLTNYQVSITIDTSDANKFHNSAADIRFTSDTSSYNERLWSVSYPYWIESGAGTTTTKIWIKIDSIPASLTKTIYMYYGNPTATSASDGTSTFELFDDFIGTSIDTSKWIVIGTNTVSNSILNTTADGNRVHSKISWTTPIIVNYRFRTTSSVGYGRSGLISGLNDITDSFHQIGIQDGSSNNWWTDFYLTSLDQVGHGTSNISFHTYEIKWNPSILASISRDGGTVSTGQIPSGANPLNMLLADKQETDYVRIRKYTSLEPTLSTPVSATSMTITPSETPCRVGLCTTAVNVTWTSTGTLEFTFVPSIKIDGVPIIPDPQLNPATVGPSRIVTQSFTVLGLTVGTHSICPDPN